MSSWTAFLLVMALALAACGPFADDDDDDDDVAVDETPPAEATPTPDDVVPATPEPDDEDLTPTPPPDREEPTPTPEEEEPVRDGETIFLAECAACHQEDGEGATQAGLTIPALNENSLVVADEPAGVLSVLMTGRGGMPRFSGVLSDEEIAEVVSYIRTAWDNDADEVDSETVTEVRQQTIGDDEDDENEGNDDDNANDGDDGEDDDNDDNPDDGDDRHQ